MIWWNPPLQGHNLGALHLDYFDLLAIVWLSLSFVSLFTMRVFVGHQHLLAHWPGFLILFDLLILDKSSSVLLFLSGRLVGTSVCFCMIVNYGNGCAF